MQLIRSGYNTAQVGKIRHWDGPDDNIWNFASFENNWYDYQGREWTWQNSSVMPDKIRQIEQFRDYEFASKAIETLGQLLEKPNYFLLAVGFKLPHLTVHVPHKYYEMYKGKADQWKLSKRELRFPPSVGEISYRCCGEPEWRFMHEEGGRKHNRSVQIGNINMVWTNEMHDEAMMGYCGGVSFVDSQVGRLLDELDRRKLWNNITVILTSDHGMMHGEKGIYEKWTLFEEAVR
jgi:iduronate 2-sulfatase